MIPSIIGIVTAAFISYFSVEASGMPGIYGIGLASIGMLSVTGMLVSAGRLRPNRG